MAALLPVLGLMDNFIFRLSLVFDHLQYLGSIGPLALAGTGLARFSDFIIPKKPWLQSSLCAGLLLILGMASWQRTWVYESEWTLWTDALAKNQNCWAGYNNLGRSFFQKRQLDEAVAQFQKALEINPNYAEAYNNLGIALFRKGQLDEAIAHYQKALEINCCPVMRSSVMDYAFSDRHLRVKKDVSHLKQNPLFWGRVLGKNYFFASCRTDPSAAVPPVCGALWRQLQGQSVFVLGSIFVHGLCATNLSRKPTRHRRLSERALRSTLPLRLPKPCVSQYLGRCQRSARLAHLRGSGGAPDQKGTKALFWPANGCRTRTIRATGLVLRSRTNLQGEELSDDELMEAVVNREPAALEAIFNRYRSMLRTIILGVVRDEADVDDVLSEVFLQIWE